ncbi:MAG: hypothetical protein IPH41_13725 [Sulfuritalea sp.]|jgi:hypothetical protein|nr:hypothetical protein [Sulfuritalea sp.]
MTAATNAERQAALKARRIAAGLVPIHLWSHAADVQAIRDHAAKLARRRERQERSKA